MAYQSCKYVVSGKLTNAPMSQVLVWAKITVISTKMMKYEDKDLSLQVIIIAKKEISLQISFYVSSKHLKYLKVEWNKSAQFFFIKKLNISKIFFILFSISCSTIGERKICTIYNMFSIGCLNSRSYILYYIICCFSIFALQYLSQSTNKQFPIIRRHTLALHWIQTWNIKTASQ